MADRRNNPGDAPLFRAVTSRSVAVGRKEDVLAERDGSGTVIVPRRAAAVLGICAQRFASEEEHRRQAAKVLGVGHASADLVRLFQELKREGLLVSLSDWVGHDADMPERIEQGWTLGVPTRGRPAALRRNLESFFHTRKTVPNRVLVVDMADADDAERQTAEVVAGLKAHTTASVITVGKAERRQLVEYACRAVDVPREALQFALDPHGSQLVNTGAARNVLLLLSTGQNLFSVDDDVVWQTVSAPSAEDCLAVRTDANLPYQIELAAAPAGPETGLNDVDIDPLTSCSEVLGRPTHLLIRDQLAQGRGVDIGAISEELFEVVFDGRSRVRLCFPGIYGDSGWANPLTVLWNESHAAAARKARIGPDEISPAALRLARSGTIYKGTDLLTTCYAADNSSSLPPFFPAGRGQDGLWGVLLQWCCPDLVSFHCPWAVRHVGSRTMFAGDPFEIVRMFHITELVTCALNAWTLPSRVMSASDRLKSMGRWLQEMARWSPTDFGCWTRDRFITLRARFRAGLENRVAENTSIPPLWKSAAQRCLTEATAAILGIDDLVLQLDAHTSIDLDTAHQWLGWYGMVLERWEDLRDWASGRAHAVLDDAVGTQA